MSIRTIIEINHDYLADLEHCPEYFERLLSLLRAGNPHGLIDHPIPGIRFVGGRHHSETLELVVK